ncbi:MAG: transcriptional repressor [Chloroflexi bacterium]|nr:transcriptional repressor [Chloroflexota bacterium]
MNIKSKTLKEKGQTLNMPGLRVTNQRALILDVIRHEKGHLDADEIYRQARKRQHRISLSTVYRTLHMLKKLGMVEEHHFDDEHHHYEIKPSIDHHHLTCLGCGKVIEFRYPLTRLVKRDVPEAKDFDITQTELHMAGYCAECQEERQNSK